MTNYDVSIHDARSEIEFDLKSSENIPYPTFRSKETLYGRKCYQLRWVSGSEYFVAGFTRNNYYAFIDALSSTTVVYIRNPNDTEGKYYLDSPLRANRNYLICIDTRERKFLFVNDTQIWSFRYSKDAPKMKIFIQEHNESSDSFVAKMRAPFDIDLPSAFFTVSDKRHFEDVTCQLNKSNRFSPSVYLIIFITLC